MNVRKFFSVVMGVATMALLAGMAFADPVAGTLTFTVTQAPGPTPGTLIPSLTWATDPNADRCVASGDWTGSRAADRSSPLVLPAVTPPKSYTLTCGWDDKDAVLSWTAPTQNTDGSPLTDLDGFKIYYGTDPANLATIIDITSPASGSHTVAGLAAGVYHFAMTAYTVSGKESARTPTVSATLGTADQAATRSLEAKIPAAPGGFGVVP